jgi:hypothetical protein
VLPNLDVRWEFVRPERAPGLPPPGGDGVDELLGALPAAHEENGLRMQVVALIAEDVDAYDQAIVELLSVALSEEDSARFVTESAACLA